jgi:hypothetical protein
LRQLNPTFPPKTTEIVMMMMGMAREWIINHYYKADEKRMGEKMDSTLRAHS